MPRVIQKTIYKFSELGEKAKDRAIDDYREAHAGADMHESTYEDAKACFNYFGFSNLVISYSGFSSQGDGASFIGDWRASSVQPSKIHEHAQNDAELDALDKAFTLMAARSPQMRAILTRTDSHYVHDNTVDATCNYGIDDGDDEGEDSRSRLLAAGNEKLGKEFIELARRCMRWVYRNLEKEYDYQNSDKAITENIEANEYEFEEDGTLV